MAEKLLPCPFCAGPAAEPDGNDFTWCPNIACFEGYMHVTTWNSRPIPIECPPAPAPHLVAVPRDRLLKLLEYSDSEYVTNSIFDEFRRYLDAPTPQSNVKGWLWHRGGSADGN